MRIDDKFRWSHLSLTTKGLIFLLMPLCLQLGFGISLIYLQQQAEGEARRSVEARTIALQINAVTLDIIQLYKFTVANPKKSLKTEGYKNYQLKPYKVLLRKVQENYMKLEKLTENHPDLNKAIKRSYRPFAEAAEIIDLANKEILAGNLEQVVATIDQKSERMAALGEEFISQELLLLAKNEEDLAADSFRKQSELRQTAVKCTFLVILGNIIFTVLLAKFLFKTITSRLRIVTDNAVKFAAQERLYPAMEGHDEIAELDHVFHQMAHTVDESAQAKQDLYNMVTHDLRTPLTAIQGCLEILNVDQTETFSPRSRKLIKVAVRNSTRTMGLVNDLLDSQKLEAGMLELDATTVHLEDVFEDVNLDISGWIEEYGIELSLPTTDLTAWANEGMLKRIIFNLISNAIKYSPRGGLIVVQAIADTDMVEISISDQGPGIPKHMLNSIFDRFRQVTENNPIAKTGSGLGLSICHDFVSLHEGDIWVTSELGKGSTFHFTIPRVQAKAYFE